MTCSGSVVGVGMGSGDRLRPARLPRTAVRPAFGSRVVALAAAFALALATGCVGAKPKPPEPGLGPAPVAATVPSPGPTADSLRIFLMTFGPGQAVWEHFGHTALWVHDPTRHTDQAARP